MAPSQLLSEAKVLFDELISPTFFDQSVNQLKNNQAHVTSTLEQKG